MTYLTSLSRAVSDEASFPVILPPHIGQSRFQLLLDVDSCAMEIVTGSQETWEEYGEHVLLHPSLTQFYHTLLKSEQF